MKDKYEKLGYTFVLPISKNGEEKVWQRTYDDVAVECNSYIYENSQIKIPPENTRAPKSLWTEDIYSNVSNGTNKLKKLFGGKSPFDFSKSIYTIKDLISLNTGKNDTVLDFFSGSATTAHATMLLNAEDGMNRNFIMVQIPEPIADNTDAYKMGYRVICDVGEERIRKAGKKLKEEYPDAKQLDVGFRVLKLDDSNMTDVYYTPER